MNNEIGALKFTHDIQVGHRLYLQPGKCQKIHGHSMTVLLSLQVHFDTDGYALNDDSDQLEFGEVKKHFRHHLDTEYDHCLLLNENDPWAQPLRYQDKSIPISDQGVTLPGLKKVPGDPCTENLTRWIAQWCAEEFRCMTYVEVKETGTNAVVRHAHPSPRMANPDKLREEAWGTAERTRT